MRELERRQERYFAAASRLHDHLHRELDAQRGYPDSPSWGYAFSVLLSAAVGEGELTPLGVTAVKHLERQDLSDPNFPWEFVVYAIQQSKRLLAPNVQLPCDVRRAKGTRMLNWFLLRQVNAAGSERSAPSTLLKLRVARRVCTTQEGLILDELRTRSLQYHAFCLFLLCELLDRYPTADFLRQWLCKGARFSASRILADGTALWIGRGQEQIFGYGALIYALEYAHGRFGVLDEPSVLDRVAERLLFFQRADGSFPLVLRGREPEAPDATFEQRPPGWYGYNTRYDYQPFLAYALWRASRLEARS